MEININKKIGSNVLQIKIDEKDTKEALSQAIFFTERDICLFEKADGKRCYSENVIWETNKAKTDNGTFTYIKRRCLACGATSTAGEYKDGGFFWKKWELFKKDNQVSEGDLGLSNEPEDYGDYDFVEEK
jgi:hypothetical protein